ncbi:Thymidylate synthase [Candidatus Methanobinarius endosymbioticus]|uniref:Thymidylate synthase n=1 Tax=Candidatus Methanobinarius endosymbioticus TaxID=2006182 RepID=A0A366MDK1_9EURY|nr:Thymidylate synthase [Candidatus Methanobinarius endosymbioticus]
MRIFILSSGEYGSKIVNGIATYGFASNIVGIHEFPSKDDLPEFIDDVSSYIPENIPESDLIIAVGLFGDINMVIPDVVKESGAKSVIAPIYHPQQLPLGLQNEIKTELDSKLDEKITIIFPKPFCGLTPIGDEFIDKFTEKFGKPEFEIKTDSESREIEGNNNITFINVLRGAPCGSTWFIVENINGISVKDAEFEANNKLHNFPCVASMANDNITGDTILHLASYKTKEAIKRALGYTWKVAQIDQETCEGYAECDNACLNSCPNVLTGVETIEYNDEGKAMIDPASCGVCEICVHECPNGAIEIYEEKIPIKKVN